MWYLLVVFLVGVSDAVEISDYSDWLKYVGLVNTWEIYKDYDSITDRLRGHNWRYNRYEDRLRDYLYSYKGQGRGSDKERDEKHETQENKREGEGSERYDRGQEYDKYYYNDQNDYYNEENYDIQNYGGYNDRSWDNKDRYNNVNLVGLGKNDREDIIRPCTLEDWQCIRKYFAKNSNCSPKNGPAPDPLYLNRNTIYYPNFNLTQIITKLRITGLGSIKIGEFYVNKDTGNLVIELNFKNLNETSPKTYYRYKRRAKESIVLEDFTTIEFRSGTFTAVIPKIPHLKLDLAEIHADIDDSTPKIFIGPEASNSKDPTVIIAFAEFIAKLPIAIREAFIFQAQLLTAIYIQENICDFGLKLLSI